MEISTDAQLENASSTRPRGSRPLIVLVVLTALTGFAVTACGENSPEPPSDQVAAPPDSTPEGKAISSESNQGEGKPSAPDGRAAGSDSTSKSALGQSTGAAREPPTVGDGPTGDDDPTGEGGSSEGVVPSEGVPGAPPMGPSSSAASPGEAAAPSSPGGGGAPTEEVTSTNGKLQPGPGEAPVKPATNPEPGPGEK